MPGEIEASSAPLDAPTVPESSADRLGDGRPRWFLRVFLVLWALVFLASVGGFLVRLVFVVRHAELVSTTGEEAPGIYAVWKAQHGHPVYEWPDRENYSISLYNYLFYWLYATVLSALGKTDGQILTAGRALTAAFAVLGAAAHGLIVRRVVPPLPPRAKRWVAAVAVLAVGLMWFGRSTVSWFALTIRPDLPGLAVSLWGMFLVVRGLERDGPAQLVHLLAAGCVFFVAWSLKQSIVLTFCGCCLYLLLRRRPKALAAVAGPFFVGCVVALLVGGPVYRRNILYMPSIAPLVPAQGVRWFLQAVVPSAFFWGMAALMPWAWRALVGREGERGERGAGADAGGFDLRERLKLVATVLAVTFVGNMVGMAKVGAGPNYMLEPMVHAVTLSVFVLAWCAGATARPAGGESARSPMLPLARLAAVALAAWSLVIPGLSLFFPQGIGGRLKWNLVYSEDQLRQRRALEQALQSAPRPMLIVDEVFSQPWHATDGKHPALVIDTISFRLAQERGIVPRTLMQDLLISGRYASGVFPMHGEVAAAAMENGFIAHGLPPEATGGQDLVVLRRPGR